MVENQPIRESFSFLSPKLLKETPFLESRKKEKVSFASPPPFLRFLDRDLGLGYKARSYRVRIPKRQYVQQCVGPGPIIMRFVDVGRLGSVSAAFPPD